jgi:hypothetical protein
LAFEPPVAPGVPSPRPEPWLAPALRDLLDRCAGLRRGLAFVHRAPPECVAAALGVPVAVVEWAQACLDRGPQRLRIIQAYAVALERHHLAAEPRPACAPPRRGPEEVIRQAEGHPLGVQFLLCAPFETAAISFGVHPEVVMDAREILHRRGVVPEASER